MRKVREADVERRVKQMVAEHNGKALKFVSPGFAGVPDRLCFMPGGRLFLVETKAPGERVRKLQQIRIDMFNALGFDAFPVANARDLDLFQEYLWSEFPNA